MAEIVFTKSHLEQNQQTEIWNVMGEYNQAIAHSSTDIDNSERKQRERITFINQLRVKLFDKWVESGLEPKCAAHVLNRMGTDVAWDKKVTLKHLTARCADRLQCQIRLDSEALFRISAVIWGLYNGAKEAIQSINLQVKPKPITDSSKS